MEITMIRIRKYVQKYDVRTMSISLRYATMWSSVVYQKKQRIIIYNLDRANVCTA